jgi:hypothetical protein
VVAAVLEDGDDAVSSVVDDPSLEQADMTRVATAITAVALRPVRRYPFEPRAWLLALMDDSLLTSTLVGTCSMSRLSRGRTVLRI